MQRWFRATIWMWVFSSKPAARIDRLAFGQKRPSRFNGWQASASRRLCKRRITAQSRFRRSPSALFAGSETHRLQRFFQAVVCDSHPLDSRVLSDRGTTKSRTAPITKGSLILVDFRWTVLEQIQTR